MNARPDFRPPVSRGVTVTVAALCAANSCRMEACGEQELARVLTRIEEIRSKQARKPKCTPIETTSSGAG